APALHAGGHRFDPDTLHHGRLKKVPKGIFFCTNKEKAAINNEDTYSYIRKQEIFEYYCH
ncbi:MAG: hypothetical protein ACLSWD_17970, partial [Clostridium sp.]